MTNTPEAFRALIRPLLFKGDYAEIERIVNDLPMECLISSTGSTDNIVWYNLFTNGPKPYDATYSISCAAGDRVLALIYKRLKGSLTLNSYVSFCRLLTITYSGFYYVDASAVGTAFGDIKDGYYAIYQDNKDTIVASYEQELNYTSAYYSNYLLNSTEVFNVNLNSTQYLRALNRIFNELPEVDTIRLLSWDVINARDEISANMYSMLLDNIDKAWAKGVIAKALPTKISYANSFTVDRVCDIIGRALLAHPAQEDSVMSLIMFLISLDPLPSAIKRIIKYLRGYLLNRQTKELAEQLAIYVM